MKEGKGVIPLISRNLSFLVKIEEYKHKSGQINYNEVTKES